MSSKDFKTIDEQIALLQSRGLQISDVESAKAFLLFNNYYRVSGYTLTLRTDDVFHPGVTFDHVTDICRFDAALRNLLLKHIETIETTVKSTLAYEFARLYGPEGYLKEHHFADQRTYASIRNKADDQKERRASTELYLQHYNNINENMPIWAYVDLFSLHDVSEFLSISPLNVQDAVADDMGVNTGNTRAKLLCKLLHGITIVRNLCAHGNRLYNRRFSQKASLSRKERLILRDLGDGRTDDDHLFAYLITLIRLLPQADRCDLVDGLVRIRKLYPSVDLSFYGFPEGWENRLRGVK